MKKQNKLLLTIGLLAAMPVIPNDDQSPEGVNPINLDVIAKDAWQGIKNLVGAQVAITPEDVSALELQSLQAYDCNREVLDPKFSFGASCRYYFNNRMMKSIESSKGQIQLAKDAFNYAKDGVYTLAAKFKDSKKAQIITGVIVGTVGIYAIIRICNNYYKVPVADLKKVTTTEDGQDVLSDAVDNPMGAQQSAAIPADRNLVGKAVTTLYKGLKAARSAVNPFRSPEKDTVTTPKTVEISDNSLVGMAPVSGKSIAALAAVNAVGYGLYRGYPQGIPAVVKDAVTGAASKGMTFAGSMMSTAMGSVKAHPKVTAGVVASGLGLTGISYYMKHTKLGANIVKFDHTDKHTASILCGAARQQAEAQEAAQRAELEAARKAEQVRLQEQEAKLRAEHEAQQAIIAEQNGAKAQQAKIEADQAAQRAELEAARKAEQARLQAQQAAQKATQDAKLRAELEAARKAEQARSQVRESKSKAQKQYDNALGNYNKVLGLFINGTATKVDLDNAKAVLDAAYDDIRL